MFVPQIHVEALLRVLSDSIPPTMPHGPKGLHVLLIIGIKFIDKSTSVQDMSDTSVASDRAVSKPPRGEKCDSLRAVSLGVASAQVKALPGRDPPDSPSPYSTLARPSSSEPSLGLRADSRAMAFCAMVAMRWRCSSFCCCCRCHIAFAASILVIAKRSRHQVWTMDAAQ